MTEHLLDVAQLVPVPQRMGGERMAQRVRRDVLNSGLARIGLEDQPEALAGQPAAAVIDEQRGLFVRGDAWPALIQIVSQAR